jgi:hypothetical protein
MKNKKLNPLSVILFTVVALGTVIWTAIFIYLISKIL